MKESLVRGGLFQVTAGVKLDAKILTAVDNRRQHRREAARPTPRGASVLTGRFGAEPGSSMLWGACWSVAPVSRSVGGQAEPPGRA